MSFLIVKDLEGKWLEVKEFFETYYRDPIDKTKPFQFKQRPRDAQIIEWYRQINLLRSELQNHQEKKCVTPTKYWAETITSDEVEK